MSIIHSRLYSIILLEGLPHKIDRRLRLDWMYCWCIWMQERDTNLNGRTTTISSLPLVPCLSLHLTTSVHREKSEQSSAFDRNLFGCPVEKWCVFSSAAAIRCWGYDDSTLVLSCVYCIGLRGGEEHHHVISAIYRSLVVHDLEAIRSSQFNEIFNQISGSSSRRLIRT